MSNTIKHQDTSTQPTMNEVKSNIPNTNNTPTKKNKTKRKLFLGLLTTTVLVGLAIYGIHWYKIGRFEIETDNAYIAGNQIQIMSEISGTVLGINVDNTDYVSAGDILVELDKTDKEQAFNKAKTSLASQVRQTQQSITNLKQNQATIEQKEIALKQAQSDLARRQALGQSNAIGKEELQHAKDAVTLAQTALVIAQEQYNANLALVLDTPIEQQPNVIKAATELKEAWLNLQRTIIKSPVSGYVSKRSVQVGGQISPNTPLMAIVAADDLWIDANFKETQLSDMRIGQKAKIVTDIYGDKVIFDGTIKGIEMGTGSAFSLLPAQNATGNWIKIVQRVPVRVELNPEQLKEHPLRIGLSSKVIVDTREQSGSILASPNTNEVRYSAKDTQFDMHEIELLINQIIAENKQLSE